MFKFNSSVPLRIFMEGIEKPVGLVHPEKGSVSL